MSIPDTQPPVAWYIQTAGTAIAHGYRWLAVDRHTSPDTPAEVMREEIAGRPLVDMVSEDMPSIVLGQRSDGRHVLVVGNLRPAAAPAKGDYMQRPIRATLLGLAKSGDAAPLLAAAAAALNDSLADLLPLKWTDDGPVIVPSGMPLSRPISGDHAANVNLRESVAVPDNDKATVMAELGAVQPHHLGQLPADRPLLLATAMVDREDLTALLPWRAVTPTVQQRTTLSKEGRSPSWVRVLRIPVSPRQFAILAAAVIGGLAFVAWLIVYRILSRG